MRIVRCDFESRIDDRLACMVNASANHRPPFYLVVHDFSKLPHFAVARIGMRSRFTCNCTKIYRQHNIYRPRAVLGCRISGCLCTLGIRPRPIALLTALATFLWLTGLNPVSLECLILPSSVMNSDIMEKFWKMLVKV